MMKAKQAWCLLASWLESILLCLGDQSICFTYFEDRDPSIEVRKGQRSEMDAIKHYT